MEQILGALIALAALAAMEIVLGIDNLVFIAILSGKLPDEQRPSARRIGLIVALVTRVLLLLTLNWFMSADSPLHMAQALGLSVINPPQLTASGPGHAHGSEESAAPQHAGEAPAVHSDAPSHGAPHHPVYDLSRYSLAERVIWQFDQTSVKDLIILLGGIFLVGKSVLEIHHNIEPKDRSVDEAAAAAASFAWVITQIAAMDIIFSLDSVITAVGMANNLWVMIAAIFIAIGVMVVFANPVSEFVDHHPSLKILALSFLILIGVMLTAEGTGQHVDKGYIYFAMGFALLVELINIRVRAVKEHHGPLPESEPDETPPT